MLASELSYLGVMKEERGANLQSCSSIPLRLCAPCWQRPSGFPWSTLCSAVEAQGLPAAALLGPPWWWGTAAGRAEVPRSFGRDALTVGHCMHSPRGAQSQGCSRVGICLRRAGAALCGTQPLPATSVFLLPAGSSLVPAGSGCLQGTAEDQHVVGRGHCRQ